MKILVLNGPNLNLLGQREPEIYGTATYGDLCAELESLAEGLGISLEIRQSNHEGALIDALQQTDAAGAVLNAGGYTHTSVALRDACAAIAIPCVEVHLTDPETREPFRRVSYLRDVCAATFQGEGFESYRKAIRFLAARGA